MGIYIFILLLLFIFTLIGPFLRKDKSFNMAIFMVSFCALWLLAGLRYDVGVDYMAYQELYSLSGDLYKMKETGFIKIIEFFNFLKLPFFYSVLAMHF